MPTVLLTIPPQAEHVRTARLLASAAARRGGVDEGVLDELRLAVGEACARAVLRSSGDSASDVVIELIDGPESFEVRIQDSGNAAGIDDEMALSIIGAVAPTSAVEAQGSGSIVTMSWPAGPVGKA